MWGSDDPLATFKTTALFGLVTEEDTIKTRTKWSVNMVERKTSSFCTLKKNLAEVHI